jgi:FtsZ-binding cell division protein ZapB
MRPEEVRALVAENERLRAEVCALRRANVELQEQVEALGGDLQAALARVGELERCKARPPSFVKPNRRSAKPQGVRKKRAAEHNTSRKRMAATRVERHELERCPECHYRLSGESVAYTREVIELPPPQPVEVIEHQVIKRWCPCCERWRSPRLELRGQVLGHGRIGVRLASLVSYLRTTLRLPVRAIQSYLATLHGLQLSVGEIVELTHAVRGELQPQADELKAAMQRSPVVHGDETGWREDGRNGYVWAFVTAGAAAVRYFEFDFSRSHLVAQRILGDFRGWLVTDFYAAYNLVRGRHQRCWSHLLRDLHTLKEEQAEQAEVLAWASALRALYDEAQAWLATHPPPTWMEREVLYTDLVRRLCRLGEQYAFTSTHPCYALAKRVLRHQDELFQFVLMPGLPADNNLAERSLRPLVVMRKISGGTRSPAGTRTRLTLASVFHTWAARHLNPFLECLAALQHLTATAPP